LFLDWQHKVISVSAPDQLFVEMMSAFLRATRGPAPRLTADEARTAIQQVHALPFSVYRATGKRTIARAFEIAHRYNQRGYDCVYVALAERKGIDFWTGDERLYNALHAAHPFVRRIADYQRQRP
jgi:predicted nucleic acid-binding protein